MSPGTSQPPELISSFDITPTMNSGTAKDLPIMEGSPQDQDDMQPMGKVQELKVLYWYIKFDMDMMD